ncbi:MAG: hypothetical protein M5R36_19395 [Deltaproteobacteria bacterium]|nr:hypothetical protein [Deltaproteobacteria bacterium]
MKNHRIILVALLVAALGAGPIALAQEQDPDESMIVHAANFMEFLRATVKSMSSALDDARKERIRGKRSALRRALRTFRRISRKARSSIRSFARRRSARIRRKSGSFSSKLRKKEMIATQLVKIVNECYLLINESGGFTETVEEFTGTDLDPLPSDFGDLERVETPEPQPPQYEPEPTSQSSEA